MNKVLKIIAQKVLLIPIVKRSLEKIYRFYATVRVKKGLDIFKGEPEFYEMLRAEQLDIREKFEERDAKSLEKVVQMVLKQKIMIAEVGSWKGFSTSILAKTVADCHGSVFAIDHWMGTEGIWNYRVANASDIYSIFKKNMILLGVWNIVHPLVMDSQTASEIFADGILDLVFIDANHRYEAVKKDISSWLPKLKIGGILCGHDCEGYYSKYPEEIRRMIDEHLGDDYIPNVCHPGVVKALHEYFQERYSIMPNSVIWYYVKRGTS